MKFNQGTDIGFIKKITLLFKNTVILRWNHADKVIPIFLLHQIFTFHQINSQLHFSDLRADF